VEYAFVIARLGCGRCTLIELPKPCNGVLAPAPTCTVAVFLSPQTGQGCCTGTQWVGFHPTLV